jgi:hypothetical protein
MKKILAFLIFLAWPTFGQDIYTQEEILTLLERSDATEQSAALKSRHRARIEEALESQGDIESSITTGEEMPEFNPTDFFRGPEETDIGFLMTQKLVGSPANYIVETLKKVDNPTDANESTTAFTYILKVAAYLGAFLVAILILYTGAGGLLHGAKDGVFLGRNWDSLFVPLRTLVAGLGTLPAPFFGGLNLAQILVLLVFLVGIGLGSGVLATLAPVLMTKPLIHASFDAAKTEDLARSILATQICAISQARQTSAEAVVELAVRPAQMRVINGDGKRRPAEAFQRS